MEIFKNPIVIWFFVGMAMFLIEMAGPGLVFLFFGIGAWAVMLLALFLPITTNTQIVLFLLISALSLLLLRKMMKKIFYGHEAGEQDLAADLDEFIGHKAEVKETIFFGSSGKVEFKGSLWNAESDEEIHEGAIVTIVAKDNLTLKVKHGS